MSFRTKINFQDNRQHRLPTRQSQDLSGTTVFGVPFSAMTTGPDPTDSGTTGSIISVVSTFSGNTGTTVFSFGHPDMDIAQGAFSALTLANSATTQNSGNVFVGNTSQTVDGNFAYLDYTGTSFDFEVTAITETSPGIFTGSGVSDDVFWLSADTLDFTGRTIWSDVQGIHRTQKLIVSDGAITGYALVAANNDGDLIYAPMSGGSSSGDTYVTGSSVDCSTNTIRFTRNDTTNIDTDITCLLSGFSTGTTVFWEESGTLDLGLKDTKGGHTVADVSYYSIAAGGFNNSIVASLGSIIAAGADNLIEGGSDASAIIAGSGNTLTLSTDRSVILGGTGITGTSNDTVYVPYLNIRDIHTGTSIANLGLDGSGNVVSGLTGDTFWEAGDSGLGSFKSTAGNGLYVDGVASFIAGGNKNTIYSGIDRSAIIAGDENVMSGTGTGDDSVIIGGNYNSMDNTGGFQLRNLIGGGYSNQMSGRVNDSAIIGGSSNSISDFLSVIIGGDNNTITSDRGVISGGQNNTLAGGSSMGIIGGDGNYINSNNSVIIGGEDNGISAGTSTNSVIVGGSANQMDGALRSVILGGTGITGDTDDMVYVPDLVIDGLTSTDPIATDANGKIVAGASDARLKKNITDLTGGLDKIKNLRGVSYEWTEESNMGEGIRYGLIAQEVKKVIPDMVRLRSKGDGMLTLNYNEVVPWLIEAVKEMSTDEYVNTRLETQTIVAEDNAIELNFGGTHATAQGGGISIKDGIREGADSFIKIDDTGRWIIGPALTTAQLTLPEYTPESYQDEIGSSGDVVWDDKYIYIKTNYGWRRTGLETF